MSKPTYHFALKRLYNKDFNIKHKLEVANSNLCYTHRYQVATKKMKQSIASF